MKILCLADLKGYTEEQVKEHFMGEYQADASEVKKYRVLIAYESVGEWGCDSSSWFLLKDKKTGKLYEVNGSHCSCNGFEGQFEPEEASTEYLKSEHFSFYGGGYDSMKEATVKRFWNISVRCKGVNGGVIPLTPLFILKGEEICGT